MQTMVTPSKTGNRISIIKYKRLALNCHNITYHFYFERSVPHCQFCEDFRSNKP